MRYKVFFLSKATEGSCLSIVNPISGSLTSISPKLQTSGQGTIVKLFSHLFPFLDSSSTAISTFRGDSNFNPFLRAASRTRRSVTCVRSGNFSAGAGGSPATTEKKMDVTQLCPLTDTAFQETRIHQSGGGDDWAVPLLLHKRKKFIWSTHFEANQ